jgi:uncharacterized protein (DUF1501 family)
VLGLKESDLKDPQGRSTIISERFGLHPALAPLMPLYDEGRIAIIAGVGSAKPNLSHFEATDQWQTGDPDNRKRDGWLGRYLNVKYSDGGLGIPAMSLRTTFAPRALQSAIDVPSISNFDEYGLRGDSRYPEELSGLLKVLDGAYGRALARSNPAGDFSRIAANALGTIQRIRAIPGSYTSSVVYPNSTLAQALRMVVQVMTALPEAGIFYVETGGFDTHARQADTANNTAGTHANLLAQYSAAITAFYADLAEHNLADHVLTMTVSEFGRQVPENGSNGTDHGTSGPVFLIGNQVLGGVYGEHPSLDAAKLDAAGNMAVTVDFRAVFSNILENWLGAEPELIVDQRFEDLGFLR